MHNPHLENAPNALQELGLTARGGKVHAYASNIKSLALNSATKPSRTRKLVLPPPGFGRAICTLLPTCTARESTSAASNAGPNP